MTFDRKFKIDPSIIKEMNDSLEVDGYKKESR